MTTARVTFALDAGTVSLLNELAGRLGKSKSAVVREAIQRFPGPAVRLSERERRRMLRAFDELVPQIPVRSLESVEAEIRAIRRARRGGGRTIKAG